jgi:hypothetical protein
MHQANTRLRAVEEMIKSDQFKSLPLYSNIYAAELWNNPYYMACGMTEQGFQWTYYILGKSGIQQLMIRDDKEFLKVTKASTLPGYRIVYKQAMKTDDAMIVLAQLDQPAATDTLISNISNKLIVVYYSTCKQFSVSFKRLDAPVGEKTKIKIAHLNDEIDPGNYVEFSIYNTKTQTPATIFTIEAPFIDIRSIRISNLAGPDGKVFYL